MSLILRYEIAAFITGLGFAAVAFTSTQVLLGWPKKYFDDCQLHMISALLYADVNNENNYMF